VARPSQSGQLDQISEAIGSLRADVRHLHDCVHSVSREVKEVDAKVDKLSAELTLDKADLAKLKAKGAGVLIGVAAASGALGAKFGAIANALTHAFK
jgi:septal ring factor EnvC (AmiA/AmiB activator)